MKIAICDDDNIFVGLLKEEIEKALSKYNENAEIFGFGSGNTLLEKAKKVNLNLIFLDIEMPIKDGYQLAEELREIEKDTYIVFVSAYDNFVFKSYEYEPLWFVRKIEIGDVIPKVIKRYLDKEKYDNFKCQYRTITGVYTISPKEIFYIEGSNHTLTINSTRKILTVYGSLIQEERRLKIYNFLRCHRNFLVNLNYVERIEQKNIVLKNGEYLPLSKDRKTQIKEKLLEG